jgi:hypothetical protein
MAVHALGSETPAIVVPGIDESPGSAVSWAAIFAGGVASAALTLLMLAFGTGMGFSVVSPWSNSGVSSATFSIWTGLYLIVVAMISSSIGGYLAGRLRTKWVGVHDHEIYFRDTAHGFLAWAFASVLGAAVLASASTQIVGATATGLIQAGASASGQSSGPLDGYLDTLLRVDPAANRSVQDLAVTRGELARLLGASLRDGGDLTAADRAYAVQLVAAKTGVSATDAERRIADVISRIKMATDNARKSAAHLALWLTASLLIGAFSASLAATEGGSLRDRKWK